MVNTPTTFKRLLVIILALTGTVSLVAAGFLTAAPQTYTIYDGEKIVPVMGNFQTVGELLAEAEIQLRVEDLVAPAINETADPDVAVQIQRAQSVTIQTERGTRAIWTLQPTLGTFLREAGVVIKQTDQIFADGIQIQPGILNQTPLPRTVEIGHFVTVTIRDGTQRQVLHTAAQTVGAILREAGLTIDADDGVEPGFESPITADTEIIIKRSFPLQIQVDGQVIQTRSHHTDVMNVLAGENIVLSQDDYTLPNPGATLKANDIVQVIRVTEDFLVEDEPIPFQTFWQGTNELPIDTQAIISHGQAGIRRRRIRVRYENGVEVSRSQDEEWVALEPINEVYGYGTRIDLGMIDTPEGPREYWRVVRMRATSYTAASSGKEPGEPGYGRTASGVQAGFGVVAVDRNIVPFRSHVFVPGYGIGFVGDTGGGIRGRWIDLGYDENNFVSWSGYVDVYYLTPVPPPEDINYILPSTLP